MVRPALCDVTQRQILCSSLMVQRGKNIVRKNKTKNGSVGSIFSRATTAALPRLCFICFFFLLLSSKKHSSDVPPTSRPESSHNHLSPGERFSLCTYGMRTSCCGQPGDVGDFQRLKWSFQPETPNLSVDQSPSTHTARLQASNHPSIHHPFFPSPILQRSGSILPQSSSFPNLRS